MSDSRNVVLASASPSRKRLLESCGISAQVIVSGVDEEDPKLTSLAPKEMVIALAILKAHTVAKLVGNEHLVIGCDSTFEFNGKSFGKPLTPELATERCKELRGNFGYLHTGHCIIDTKAGIEISDVSTSKVFFADMTDGEIAKIVQSVFDMRPYFIEQRFKLRTPIYSETAAYGHMGRKNEVVTKTFKSPDGNVKTIEVELFTWEKLDFVDKVKAKFNL